MIPPASPDALGSAADRRLAASSTLEMPGAFLRVCVLASRRQRSPKNAMPALRSLSLVAGNYGLPQRNLGTVSVVGPTRMDYRRAIATVREAAHQLSRFIEDVYEES